MEQPPRDEEREERITMEIIVDAYGPEEQAMGWHCYLDNKIRFPFQAKCIAAKAVSPLLEGESVEVRGMAPEEACASDMLVLIKWQGRTLAVPPCLNCKPSRGTKQPMKPSRIGITG